MTTPPHPGEILADDLAALGWSAAKFAAHLGVATNAISEIIAGRQGISPRMALFIGKAFGTGPEIWLNLQRSYDLRQAHEKFAPKVVAIRELERPAARRTSGAEIENGGIPRNFSDRRHDPCDRNSRGADSCGRQRFAK